MKLTFCGGAGVVTGANYLLEAEGKKILVDCGLEQGEEFAPEVNLRPFPYDPAEIDAVFVTHAHIDHVGRIPQLVKAGFRGIIVSTPPTKEIAELLLLDSERVLGKEADLKGTPHLYTEDDVKEAVMYWQTVEYHTPSSLGEVTIEFYDAGHVLGSSSILITAEGKKVVFSGDLGNTPAPFIRPIEYFENVDYALIESAYGNRIHEHPEERKNMMEDAIEDTVRERGVLMIPAFAMERTQEMIFELNELVEGKRIPKIPVYVDSPLAIKLTEVYKKYMSDPDYFNDETVRLAGKGDGVFDFPGLIQTATKEESKKINDVPPPKIVIAGAGMSNGGRILYHEVRYLPDPKSTLLIVGYQAKGSLGRALQDGAKSVVIEQKTVQVRCHVKTISGYSAHADQPQLMKWVETMRPHVKKIFVVQGDKEESEVFAQKIKDELAIASEVPLSGETAVL